MKLSPFYRLTSNQTIQVSLPGGLGGGFNAATAKNTGVEFALQKGDVSRNGFSGQLSYTYTYSLVKFGLINGANAVTAMLGALEPLESLEKINGGAPCYYQGEKVADCHKAQKIGGKLVHPSKYVYNPYYNFTYTNAELASERTHRHRRRGPAFMHSESGSASLRIRSTATTRRVRGP